jgi:16S rRNA processing protein RimM
MEKLISIGYTKKMSGIKGELKVSIEDQYLEDYLQTEVVFLKIQGKNAPFFIEKHHVSNSLMVKFEDVNNRNDALPLTGKEILLREKDLIPEEAREFEVTDTLEFKKYEGYLIADKTAGDIGKIEEVVEFPQQEMAVVTYQDNEIYLPLHEDLMLEIDEVQQRILVELPEGLLDL